MRYLSSQNQRDQSIKVVAKGWGKRERNWGFIQSLFYKRKKFWKDPWHDGNDTTELYI